MSQALLSCIHSMSFKYSSQNIIELVGNNIMSLTYLQLAGAEKVEGLQCDVQDEGSVHSCLAQASRDHGPISVLVNAAGVNRDRLLVQTSSEDMATQLQTNLVGSMYTCKAAVKHMMRQKAGCIINIGNMH